MPGAVHWHDRHVLESSICQQQGQAIASQQRPVIPPLIYETVDRSQSKQAVGGELMERPFEFQVRLDAFAVATANESADQQPIRADHADRSTGSEDSVAFTQQSDDVVQKQMLHDVFSQYCIDRR
jgi:hypothetical protein